MQYSALIVSLGSAPPVSGQCKSKCSSYLRHPGWRLLLTHPLPRARNRLYCHHHHYYHHHHHHHNHHHHHHHNHQFERISHSEERTVQDSLDYADHLNHPEHLIHPDQLDQLDHPNRSDHLSVQNFDVKHLCSVLFCSLVQNRTGAHIRFCTFVVYF